MICPICDSPDVDDFIAVAALPLLLFPVDEAAKDEIAAGPLQSHRCGRCNHIFTPPLPHGHAELIYGSYYRFYPFEDLETMNAAYRQPFEDFFERVLGASGVDTAGRSLLEIGCSSGEALKSFEGHGLRCQGIDPSPLNVDASGTIISGLYESHEFDRPYDILVSRFNLEHVNDLHEFFQKAKRDLTDGGILFVQVPNVPTFTVSCIPLFLAHEHVHYFNAHSLRLAAERHGFGVLDIEYSGSQSILAAVQKGSKTRADLRIERVSGDFYARYLRQRSRVAEDVRAFLGERDGMLFYGAGLALCWILYELGLGADGAGIVFDDNPLVSEKYLPRTNLRVVPLSAPVLQKHPAVTLTLNPTYHERVVQKLRRAEYAGEVFALGERGLQRLTQP